MTALTPDELGELLSPPRPKPTVTLPFDLVLGWFMASDPSPLSSLDDTRLRHMLDRWAQDPGYEDWVEAFHRL